MTLPPSEALGQLTSCVISANAPSMSRWLNAEYACSITVFVSAIDPPVTLALNSLLIIRCRTEQRDACHIQRCCPTPMNVAARRCFLDSWGGHVWKERW